MISPVLTITEGMNMKNQNQKNWGQVCCKGKCLRVGKDYKEGEKQEDEEICGGTCRNCGGEE